MHAVQAVNLHEFADHVALPSAELQPGMQVQITETEYIRDDMTDEMAYQDNTWQAQVLDVSEQWNAPSELLVSFYDGPGAWVLKDAMVTVVSGPLNSSGKF